MEKNIQFKTKIAECGARRYVQNSRFTYRSLAFELSVDETEISKHFSSRSSLLRYFYESRILLHQEQIDQIDDYATFSLGEKLSNLFLTLFDLFDEHREFVQLTYDEFTIKHPDSCFKKLFLKEIEQIFSSDNRIAASSGVFINQRIYLFMFYSFNTILKSCFCDDTKNHEHCMALTDKLCSFVEELFYTQVLDKGFDLGKFLIYNSPLKSIFEK
jgi:hypothetical protein